MSEERTTPPVPNYEDLSAREVDERVRSLPAERVRELIAYEESHSNRMEFLEVLKDRLQELEGGDDLPQRSGPEGGPRPNLDADRAQDVPRSAERPPDRPTHGS